MHQHQKRNDLPLISGQSIFQNGEQNDLKVSSLSAKEARRGKAAAENKCAIRLGKLDCPASSPPIN
nr:hypothetical protein Q903MT_gene3027 [Picea sitchensis]